MKKILVVAALFAGMSMAEDRIISPVGGKDRDTSRVLFKLNLDSLRKADSALIAERRQDIIETLREQRSKDSALFSNRLSDSLRAKIEKHVRDFDAKKSMFDSVKTFDSAKIAEFKVKADSLRKNWEAKRDSQIANIKNDTVRAKVQARIAEIAAKREAVKAKIEARKAEIEAKIAELKAKLEKIKAEKATTTP